MFPNPDEQKQPIDFARKSLAPTFKSQLDNAIANGDFSNLTIFNERPESKTAQQETPSFMDTIKKAGKSVASSAGNLYAHPAEIIPQTADALGDFTLGLGKGLLNAVPYVSKTEKYTPEELAANPFIAADKGRQAMGKITEGGVGDLGDKLYRESWVTAAMTAAPNVSEETASSLFDAYMSDRSQVDKITEGAGNFSSYFLPYTAVEKTAIRGLEYAAPQFVKNHELATKLLASGVGGAGAAQWMMGPNATAEERLDPKSNAINTAAGPAFEVIGPLFKAAKNVIFRNISKTKFAEGAQVEPFHTAPGPDAPIAVVKANDGSMSVATNNIEALRNYIKGSGKTNVVIDERSAGRVGMTQEGLPITAKHKYNAKDGVHTITVSSAADAQTIAHEWGHYINDDTARQVRGLSNYLLGDATQVKDVQGIEDTLRSLSMRQLVDEGHTTIPGEMIDKRMTELVSSIRSEIRSLASARPGIDGRKLSGEKKFSEQLSDAVSTTLTGESANRRTNFHQFLQEARVVDDELVASLRAGKRAEDQVAANGQAPATGREQRILDKQDATRTKVGLGGEAPTSPVRPPNRKFEATKAQQTEQGLSSVADRFVGRTEAQVAGYIAKNKIPGKNLIELSGKGKKPVTLIVHEIDRVIAQAVVGGAKKEYMDYAKKAVQREFGYSEKQAEAYIASRFNELKQFAESHSDGEGHVVAKVMQSGEVSGPKAAAAEMEKALTDSVNAVDGAKKNFAASEKDIVKAQKDVDKAKAKLFKAKEMQSTARTPEMEMKRKAQVEEARLSYEDARKNFQDIHARGEDSKRALTEAEGGLKTKQEELGREADPVDVPDEAFNESRTTAAAAEPDSFAPEAAERPMRVELDRMETGKQPKSAAFKAENMTHDVDEETFLNTKILPKISGKERIGRSNADILSQAEASKLTEGEALNMLKDRYGALTPDTRKLFEYGMEKTRGLIKMLDGRTPESLSPEELTKFKDELGQATQLWEVYTGARTEAGNLLRSFGIASENGENDVLREMFGQLQKSGLTGEKDVWKAMAKMYDTTKANPWYNKFYKVLFASWLSGPATSIRNIVGSVGSILANVASKGANPKTMKELPAALSDFWRGFKNEGLTDAKQVLKGKDPSATASSKFMMHDPAFPLAKDAFGGKDEALYLRMAENVSRWLNAQDIALTRGATAMERGALRIYKPDISEAVGKALSEQYGLAAVYRGMPRGSISRGLVEGAEALTRRAPIMRMVIPFIRTIGNVTDRQFDYMPIFSQFRATDKFLMESARDIAKTYGISSEKDVATILQRLKDQQQGRAYFGLALTAATAGYAFETGNISGNGPSDYQERLQLERTGWRRNSIKMGDTWVPYTYFGPMAGILSLVGNIHDSAKYNGGQDGNYGEMLAQGIGGWMQTQLNSSFLTGASNLLDAMKSGEWGKYLTDTAASLVPIPAAYSQTLGMARNVYSHIVDDPTLRQQYETKNIVDKIRVKLGVPGAHLGLKSLNPRLDMFGEPMKLDFIYGVSPTQDKRDAMPVENFLINKGVHVTLPSRNQTYTIHGKKDQKLTDEQFNEYAKLSGEEIYTKLGTQLKNMEKMSNEELQNKLEDITRTARARARVRVTSKGK